MALLGPAPILDFDGTIARLPVDRIALRAELGVSRIDDLWATDDRSGWERVREAECAAVTRAELVDPVVKLLGSVRAFAVLTSNSETAVRATLPRLGAIGRRAAVVVGRETLGGPKTSFERFAHGFATCVDATAAAREDADLVYVGDMQYELGFAERLGAHAVDVSALAEGSPA